MPIYFDGRWTGPYGIGRFSGELERRLHGLENLSIARKKISPLDPVLLSLALKDKREGCFFSPGFQPPLRSPVPVAFTMHDIIDVRAPGAVTWRTLAYFNLMVRPLARRAWRLLTVSEFSRRDIIEWCGVAPERVHVVGNGVAPEFQPDDTPFTARRYFLHVGRRPAYKNIERLLRAFSNCKARTGGFTLMFTGKPDAATLAMARCFKVEDHVRFSGFVSDAGLVDLYRNAIALVFPSLYEGFGLPIVEAMACGTPVVTSAATSTAEVGSDGNALLVDPCEIDAIAQAMDQVAGDEILWRTLRAKGISRARTYDWDTVARRVAQVLGTTASPPGGD